MTVDAQASSIPPELIATAPPFGHTPRKAGLILWKDVLLEHVRSSQPDLTNRQMAVLLAVYVSNDTHTIGSLVATLALPEPAVSRSVIALEALGYLKRSPHPTDARRALMQRTASGAVFLAHLETTIAKANSRCATVGAQDSVAEAASEGVQVDR